MWNGAMVATFFLLAACAEDQKQRKEAADAIAQAAAEVELQDDARCQSFGKPGSMGYLECRMTLKRDRAAMRK
jgi:outer membrane biogenesis lipoprotein LolB